VSFSQICNRLKVAPTSGLSEFCRHRCFLLRWRPGKDALQAEEHFEARLVLGKATRKHYFEVVYHVRDAEALGCCSEIGWIEILSKLTNAGDIFYKSFYRRIERRAV
jgi:hypothetical protein